MATCNLCGGRGIFDDHVETPNGPADLYQCEWCQMWFYDYNPTEVKQEKRDVLCIGNKTGASFWLRWSEVVITKMTACWRREGDLIYVEVENGTVGIGRN